MTLNDDHLLARCYYLLAGVENRIENYKKAIYYFQKTPFVNRRSEV